MRKVCLLSPHFDDAILSAGQFMAGRPDTEVITIFGGYPNEPGVRTEYDKKCGFESALQAINVRRDEDNEATALLRATAVHLDFSDSQYSEYADSEVIMRDLAEHCKEQDYEYILAPMGLDHPDHKLTTNLAFELSTELSLPLYLWEDMPTRVIYPELVNERIAELPLLGRVNLGGGPIADKIRAVSAYASQIGTGILDPYVMYVPERFWGVK